MFSSRCMQAQWLLGQTLSAAILVPNSKDSPDGAKRNPGPNSPHRDPGLRCAPSGLQQQEQPVGRNSAAYFGRRNTRSLSSGAHSRDPLAMAPYGLLTRHCERSEAIHWATGMDCFVAPLLAMTGQHVVSP